MNRVVIRTIPLLSGMQAAQIASTMQEDANRQIERAEEAGCTAQLVGCSLPIAGTISPAMIAISISFPARSPEQLRGAPLELWKELDLGWINEEADSEAEAEAEGVTYPGSISQAAKDKLLIVLGGSREGRIEDDQPFNDFEEKIAYGIFSVWNAHIRTSEDSQPIGVPSGTPLTPTERCAVVTQYARAVFELLFNTTWIKYNDGEVEVAYLYSRRAIIDFLLTLAGISTATPKSPEESFAYDVIMDLMIANTTPLLPEDCNRYEHLCGSLIRGDVWDWYRTPRIRN